MKKSHHVISSVDGGWSVHRTGAAKASRRFTTQKEAIQYGKRLAKKEHADLYIHRKDGTILERDSYAADTSPASVQR